LRTDATGEAEIGPQRLRFDRSVKLAFRGSAINSDGGLLLYRELDDALGLTDVAARVVADARTGKNGRHHLAWLLRHGHYALFQMAEAALPRRCSMPSSTASTGGAGRPPWRRRRDRASVRIAALSWRRRPSHALVRADSDQNPDDGAPKRRHRGLERPDAFPSNQKRPGDRLFPPAECQDRDHLGNVGS